MVLRQILQELESAQGPVSLNDLSRKLGVERGALEGMIAFLARKGRLGDHVASLTQDASALTDDVAVLTDDAAPLTDDVAALTRNTATLTGTCASGDCATGCRSAKICLLVPRSSHSFSLIPRNE